MERGFPCARPLTPALGVGALAVHAEESWSGGELLRGNSPESCDAVRVQAAERLRRANTWCFAGGSAGFTLLCPRPTDGTFGEEWSVVAADDLDAGPLGEQGRERIRFTVRQESHRAMCFDVDEHSSGVGKSLSTDESTQLVTPPTANRSGS
jgi:hypothetical protein